MSADTPAPDAAALARALYDLGPGIVYASRHDPRFSYTTYVPPHIAQARHPMRLIVVVHGTGRAFVEYRDAFAEFARWNDCIVLCPLFPAGVLGDGNRDGFKHLREGDIRYDDVLLDMVDDVAQKFACDFSRFMLFGFSGGGQFVERFALLHPGRLRAVSIGAPGSVTLLDPDKDWWVGTRGMAERYGKELDLDALRKVAVHMIVGKADLETWEITHQPGGKYWMPGCNDAGRTRPERLASLKRSFEAAGIGVHMDVVDNVPHDGMKCVGHVQEFFLRVLREDRGEG
jgi:pimeloyl-ACP methyl ester carboxylesterase